MVGTSHRAIRRVAKKILTEPEHVQMLVEISDVYHRCSDAIQQHRTVLHFFTDHQLSVAERCALLTRLESVPDAVLRLFSLFMESGAIEQLQDMDEMVDRLIAEVGSLHRCQIRTAVPVDPTLRQEIISVLERRFEGNVIAEFLEDPELLGGLEVHCGTWSYFGTLRATLNQLRQHLAIHHTHV